MIEAGFKPSDKLAVWLDSTNSAEAATAQVGAIKAGMSVVTFDEGDSVSDVSSALKDSGARGLLFSPTTVDEHGEKRANALHEHIPEIDSMYPGDEFSCAAFPELQHLIHTGHKTIHGMTKFKESMLYTKRRHTHQRIAGTSPETTVLECYRNGSKVASFTNQELVDKSDSFWSKSIASHGTLSPVFVTLSM